MQKTFVKCRQPDELARDILQFAENTLLINLRFLKMALFRLEFCPDPKTTLATDGEKLFYGFTHILKLFSIQNELVNRGYLHIVLHCIFHHPFVNPLIDHHCWDLACDIAVEAAIEELELPCVEIENPDRKEIINYLHKKLKYITAERVYHHYRGLDMPPEKLATLRELFLADTHELWYQLTQRQSNDSKKFSKSTENDSDSEKSSSAVSGRKNDEEDSSQMCNKKDNPAFNPADNGTQKIHLPDHTAAQQRWENISSRIQTDMEAYSLKWSMKAGCLIQGLREGNREQYDYASFLKRFAVNTEAIGINDDEFDYIFYTYGLKLYGNMPLLEPLEYKDTKRIKEFVIAIDTSASVQGKLVEKFAARTYEILKQTESFSTRIQLYIIQCDANIQEIKKISEEHDFREWFKNMRLRGFGGTDFRPVFKYVDELRDNRELTDLKGLIYFTDGKGEYPSRPPEYSTAFVFVDNDCEETPVPVWAMKVKLTAGEIHDLSEARS
jgi:predicted metal-dependent peptidase